MGDIGGAVFNRDPDQYPVEKRREELLDRLRRGPGEPARQEMGFPEGVLPSRWRLRTIRATVDWLSDYTLSGLWRLLRRLGLKLRSGRVQQYSPDPDYAEKEARLLECLGEATSRPEEIVALFMDEMAGLTQILTSIPHSDAGSLSAWQSIVGKIPSQARNDCSNLRKS